MLDAIGVSHSLRYSTYVRTSPQTSMHESQNRTMGIADSLYLLDKEAREDWRVGCQN
jgi:hypothetical protein